MPAALEKTWYSDVDYTGWADITTTTTWHASTLWAIKQCILGNALNTNQPAGARWTTYYSCDGTTAGTANDGVDRWGTSFDATKVKNVSTTRSWYVFKSPTGVNSYGPFYLMIDYGTGSTSTVNWFVSKTAPTGGSITAAPTATDSSSNSAVNFVDTASATAMKMSRTTDANGNFFLCWAKTGTGRPTHSIGFLTLTDGPSGDTWPCFAFLDGASADYVWHHYLASRLNISSSNPARTRSYNNVTSNPCLTIQYYVNTGSPQHALDLTSVDAADGKYVELPSWWMVVSSPIQWKGRLQDFWVSNGPAQNTAFTRSSVVTHVYFGGHWIPFNIQPTW